MPRRYQKVLKPWNEETVKIALREVDSEDSVHSTAHKYHMSVSTLRNRAKGVEHNHKDVRGRKTALTEDEELPMADEFRGIEKEFGHGLIMTDFQDEIKFRMEYEGILNPFTNNRPGFAWVLGFVK